MRQTRKELVGHTDWLGRAAPTIAWLRPIKSKEGTFLRMPRRTASVAVHEMRDGWATPDVAHHPLPLFSILRVWLWPLTDTHSATFAIDRQRGAQVRSDVQSPHGPAF